MNTSKQTLLFAFVAIGSLSSVLCAQNGGSPAGNPAQGGATGQKPAATQPGQNPAGRAQSGMSDPVLERGDKLVGRQLTDSTGAVIGAIDDVVLDSRGRVSYAIISTSSGTKVYPVPWNQLMFRPAPGSASPNPNDAQAARRIPVPFTKDRFKEAPGFEKASWPRSDDLKVFEEASRFYTVTRTDGSDPNTGSQPVDASSPTPASFVRASRLSNQAITDAQGNPIGKISQVVYDPASGRVNYAAVALTGKAGAAPRTIAVPWELIQTTRKGDEDQFRLAFDANRLESAPQFKNDEPSWNSMSDRKYLDELYAYYALHPYWTDTMNERPDNGQPPDKK